MQRILFLFLFTAIFLFWEAADFSVQQVLAQNYAKEDEKALIAEKERQKFLTEMQTLLNAASKAGFSEKEIREITVTRKGKVVHVWDFLEQAKLQQKKDALAKKRSKPRERYLTVMDIAEEMQSGETRDLDAIKDKSTFIGAEEK
ncbi:MAG: hypothetical protein HN351_13915 [Deltaproteobacteria bacterium]|jgi:acetyl-CoA acetyltransferase|nr:hypothetical protein [Deltaproteobacteria bacterium]